MIRMRHGIKSKSFFGIIGTLLFIILSIYFADFTARYPYSGISSDYREGKWVIRQIHKGGEAASSMLSVGDEIVKIDNEPSESNDLLNKMLIVEQASSVLVRHNGSIKQITLNNDNVIYDFYGLSLLSLLILILLGVYIRRQERSKTSLRYYVFLFLTALFLIAIIPSSMGNSIARFIVIAYVTIFPLFIDVLCRVLILDEAVTIFSWLSRIIIFYSVVTLILFLYATCFDIPLYLASYLTRFIFYISLFFLLLSLSFALYGSIKGKKVNRLRIIFPILLGLIPFLVGYIFPIADDVPVSDTIPLLIFPILMIINSLITRQLIHFRIHISNSLFYFLAASLGTIDLVCIYPMTNYLPKWLLVGYIFLLIISFLPTFRELLIINAKTDYQLLDNLSIFSAVEAEREAISISLHDTVIQDVIYYKKQLDDKEVVSKRDTLELLDDVIFELRGLCSDIYPLMIKELGLKNAILDIIDKFQKKESVMITCEFTISSFNFENNIANFILRSIKEIITNSINHGQAKNITIHIFEQEQMTVIEISDDGYFEKRSETTDLHFGLNVITEKLFLLGGKLNLTKNPTSITLFVPNDRR